jgi:uncharacterized peroxidase-related enzyme
MEGGTGTMSAIQTVISDLGYSRSQLLKVIEGLSNREMTHLPIYGEWTIKDVLAHVIGWDERVIKTLPLMLAHRASEIPDVEVDAHNRQSVAAWRDKSLAEVIVAIKATHRQIMQVLSKLDDLEIDMRRERYGRVITIRSYVVDVMMEHEREHALEIEQWRQTLKQNVDLKTLQHALARHQADFWLALEGLDEPDLLDKGAVGEWSIKDVTSHIADWEELILLAARHIYDLSLTEAPVLGSGFDEINNIIQTRRAGAAWQTERKRLRAIQLELEEFVAQLTPGDGALRGPYPWPNDQGTLTELITHAIEHYTDHLSDITHWRSQKLSERPPSKPWLPWVSDENATGLLKKEFETANKRAGSVWNIVRVMSLNPPVMQASMRLYGSVMHRTAKMLGRAEREMIAVVVSQINQCHYLIQAHLHDLRGEVDDADLIDRFAQNWRTAGLSEPVQAMLTYVEKMTRTPAEMTQSDIHTLRRHGFTAADIHDIVQIAAYFNYINRLANALGVPPEDFMLPWLREDGAWDQ